MWNDTFFFNLVLSRSTNKSNGTFDNRLKFSTLLYYFFVICPIHCEPTLDDYILSKHLTYQRKTNELTHRTVESQTTTDATSLSLVSRCKFKNQKSNLTQNTYSTRTSTRMGSTRAPHNRILLLYFAFLFALHFGVYYLPLEVKSYRRLCIIVARGVPLKRVKRFAVVQFSCFRSSNFERSPTNNIAVRLKKNKLILKYCYCRIFRCDIQCIHDESGYI